MEILGDPKRRRGTGRRAGQLPALACVHAVFVLGGPDAAWSQVQALVSNVGQTRSGSLPLGTEFVGQAFTTGTIAGRYGLSSIQLRLRTGSSTDTPTVTLRIGAPRGSVAATLSGRSALTANTVANYAFTPSATFNLSRSTEYWVVATGGGSGLEWEYTSSDSEDATPATGWSIDNWSRTLNSNTFTSVNASFQFRVNGEFDTSNTAPTASSGTVTTHEGRTTPSPRRTSATPTAKATRSPA